MSFACSIHPIACKILTPTPPFHSSHGMLIDKTGLLEALCFEMNTATSGAGTSNKRSNLIEGAPDDTHATFACMVCVYLV